MKESLRVLGLAGSPRRDGNTELLLREAMAGAASKGAKVKTVILSKLEIAPSRHCDGCLESGECLVPDEICSGYIGR